MRRARYAFFAVALLFALVAAQLVRVQAVDASSVAALANDKRLVNQAVPAVRGSITDASGAVLASSEAQFTVTVNQQAVAQYAKRIDGKVTAVGAVGAANDLAPLLGTTPDALLPQLVGDSQYRIIAKGVSAENWRKVQALGVNGIYAEQSFKRVYPTGQAAANLVGFLQQDGTAGAGIEQMLNPALAGTPGRSVYQRGQDGTMIPTAQEQSTPAVNGSTVRTTLDADLQWYAENTLAQAVQSANALSGDVVVEDATTGELKAVASYPSYDPTDLAHASSSSLVNLPFQEAYEPGSTGKVMSMAAAIETGVANPGTKIVVPNRLPRSDKTFKDDVDHPTEYLTLAGALAQSSNIGTMLATEKVPPSTMEGFYRKFGMGATSGIGFPGESAGILAPSSQWSGSQRYTVLFGQGYSMTAIQGAEVYQTIANGGVRVPPSLIEGTTSADGTYTPAAAPQGVRVVSQSTASQVSGMLEEVVGPGGTAPAAKIPGYRVAGKTGTADRYDTTTGGYNGFTASFIGYAPADNPKFVVAVILQRPVNGHFGGVLAAPVFQKVMSYALQKYQVPPTGATAPAYPLDAGKNQTWDIHDPAVIYDPNGHS